MRNRVSMVAAIAIGLGPAWAQVLPTPPRKAGEPSIRSVAGVTALHDEKSKQYNANCLASGCHSDIFNRVSLNSAIPRAHRLAGQMGIPAAHCRFCHESTEIVRGIRGERGNVARLGKNVDPETRCYPCHGQYGPAKKLYSR